LKAIEKPIYVEGKIIKCSRAFLKQEVLKQYPNYRQEHQKVTISQKTTDESKESPDSSFDVGLSEKKSKTQAHVMKSTKSKLKSITTKDTQSEKEETNRSSEHSSGYANPSPMSSSEPFKEPWVLGSPAQHKRPVESWGLLPNNQHTWTTMGSGVPSPDKLPECSSYHKFGPYACGVYPEQQGNIYASSEARFSYSPSLIDGHYPTDSSLLYPQEHPGCYLSARNGGVIGQRFRGMSEHETTGSGLMSQWDAPGTHTPLGACHHQGYSSSGWTLPMSAQGPITPCCTIGASTVGSQRKGGQGKPSSRYRMF
jgi:hypothetical protein